MPERGGGKPKPAGVAWHRVESSRAHPSWGNVMRRGARVALIDELHRARERMARPLLRLQHEWLDEVPDGVGMDGWRADPQPPVLNAVAVDFQVLHPERWAPIERRLLDDDEYRARRAEVAEIEDLLDRQHDLEDAGGHGRLPDGIGLLQEGGRSELDAFVELTGGGGSAVVVDRRFTDALTAAGLTDGWRTAELELRDKRGGPVATHRLLVVTARVTARPSVVAAHGRLPDDARTPLARSLAHPQGRVGRVHVSAAAVRALTSAGLRGLAFPPATDLVRVRP